MARQPGQSRGRSPRTKPPVTARRVTVRERAAFHEAGHVIGWLSSPFAKPDIYGVTIEPDRRHGLTGEVRQRAHPSQAPVLHRLAVGRALSRGKLIALATALATLSAEVRAHLAGPMAEALRLGVALPAVEEGECDYWNAYEICAAADLDPDVIWRAEARRARRWLRRHWDRVEHLAALLLRQPPGRRMLAGAPLKAVVRQTARLVRPSFDAPCYEGLARRCLAHHRDRWRDRPHWVVVERRRPRGIGVAWAEDEPTASLVARELQQAFGRRARFEVQRRRPRRPAAPRGGGRP